MAIKVKATAPPPKPTGHLNPGDTISISLTSEVKIDRDINFIKVEITSKVDSEESGDVAYDRVLAFTQAKFESTVMSAVSQIQAMGA